MGYFDFFLASCLGRLLKRELGYKSAMAWPIFERQDGGKIMYYMIHASDHEEAPTLMIRAHHKAVRSLPREVQQPIQFPNNV